MLGHLAAEERAPRLATAGGDTADDRGRDIGVELAHREVVEEEERGRALRRDVVGSPDQIDADGVVPAGGPGQYRLRPDAVGRRDQDRVVHLQCLEVEQPPEATEAAEHAGTVRGLRVRLDHFDGTIAGRDVDAGGRVRQCVVAHAGPVRSTTGISNTDLASRCVRSTRTG